MKKANFPKIVRVGQTKATIYKGRRIDEYNPTALHLAHFQLADWMHVNIWASCKNSKTKGDGVRPD
jgi:hypothetical protein